MAQNTLVEQFHTALVNSDADTLSSIVTPNVKFIGPMAQASGAEEVVKGLSEMGSMITSDTVSVQLSDENNALIWSAMTTSAASETPAATWLRFENGRIAEIQTIFNAGR